MKKNYKVTGSDRKALVQVIGQTIGVKPVYMKVPTCAYAIGDITVDKEGNMIWDERTDEATIQQISKALAAAGFMDEHSQQEVEEQPAPEATESEPVELTVSLPTTRHTGNTLRNLVNLVYTRAGLINKALGTRFAAEKELTEVLAEAEWIYTAEDFRLALASYEEEHGPALTGITIKQTGPGTEAHSCQGSERGEREIRAQDLADPPGDERPGVQGHQEGPDGEPFRTCSLPY